MANLLAAGYPCTRAAGSKGLWDIIAIAPMGIRLIQIKTRLPSKAERQAIAEFYNQYPWLKNNGFRVIFEWWVWDKGRFKEYIYGGSLEDFDG